MSAETSSTTKHTPGPWKLYMDPRSDPAPGGQYVLGAPGKNGETYVATIETARCHDRHRYSAPGEAAEANARLIAAAPELLSACKVALEVLQADELSYAECRVLEAAIAKAEPTHG